MCFAEGEEAPPAPGTQIGQMSSKCPLSMLVLRITKVQETAPTVYLAILVRKMWDELFKKLLGGDSGVHQLAQGNVGLLPHALPRVSQPEM